MMCLRWRIDPVGRTARRAETTRRSTMRSLLFEHQQALPADRRSKLFGDLGEQPRQTDRNDHLVVRHVERAGGLLAKRRGAKTQPVAGPSLLRDGQDAGKTMT